MRFPFGIALFLSLLLTACALPFGYTDIVETSIFTTVNPQEMAII